VREYGLIGYPLSHSFSQKYFTEKFEKEKISDAIFHAFSLPSIDVLPNLLQTHPLLKGFAITIPYKRAIIPYLQYASEAVQQMNACNCVKITDGKLYGYNTDVIGFERSFVKHLKPHYKNALILGTGGAASAVEFVLKKLKINYRFVSRTKDDEKKIIGYDDLDNEVMSRYQIIINCTPLGTYPKTDEAPSIPYRFLTSQHYLFDLVYNPSKSKFLSRGEQHGATIQNGYEMLVLQAEENWKIWND
jgi:shikimate dehydrogenase